MSELKDRVSGARILMKMYSKNHLIRVANGDEWKTAFWWRYGQYEFKIMPFGLTNAPATFQDMMKYILKDLLYESVVD
jgi:hypothetical protein